MIRRFTTTESSLSPLDEMRLDDARRAFQDAQEALESARARLLRTHVETTRLWSRAV